MKQDLIHALFQTGALRICDPETPFWYTSGKLGPFYINTHFLYGSEAEANALLADIERESAQDRLGLPQKIAEETLRQYEQNAIYRQVIDALAEVARMLDFDVISGGERRDFFFSLPLSRLLQKPHITIYKDLSAVYTPQDFARSRRAEQSELRGARSLHVADLVTEASSYLRAWIPALAALDVYMPQTAVVVDRLQGGEEILGKQSVRLHSLIQVDEDLLHAAREQNQINSAQRQMVLEFLRDPDAFMYNFLSQHPDFIRRQIALGGKAEERARLAVEKGYAALEA